MIKNGDPANLSFFGGTYSYSVNLKLQPLDPPLHCEPVLPADLIETYSEVWLSAYLRNGQPETGFNDLAFRLLPVFAADSSNRCRNVMVECKQSDGKILYSPSGIEVLRTVAVRGAQQLIETGKLVLGQPYFYDVTAVVRAEVNPADDKLKPDRHGSSKIEFAPLKFRKVRLSSLLEKATTVGTVQDCIPIFVTRSTYTSAEQSARSGARCDPPVESGAVVLGWLGSCPETGEFFVVATEVIELVDAVQRSGSLTYTDKTWANIQAALKERQRSPGSRAERIVGQCHGHNFLPCSGDKDCRHCAQRHTCEATSVFVSDHDQLWSRCVFSRQPWAFCHIFGLDAGGGPVQRMFGFRQGRLVERGFYLIPENSL